MNQTIGSNFIVYKASAGSGKTYTLAAEYISQLLIEQNNYAYKNILAVTFTKDATGEMKSRILQELYGLAMGLKSSELFATIVISKIKIKGVSISEKELQTRAKKAIINILHDYSHFNVGTIDSFFQRVLRNLARELGANSKFNIEMNTSKILNDTIKLLINTLNDPNNKEILTEVESFISDKIKDNQSIRIKDELSSFAQKLFNETYQAKEDSLSCQILEKPNILNNLKIIHTKRRNIFISKMDSFVNQYFVLLKEHNIPYDEYKCGNFKLSNYYSNKIAKKLYNDYELPTSSLYKFLNCDNNDCSKWTKNKNYKDIAIKYFLPLLDATESYRKNHIKEYNSSYLLLKNINQFSLLRNIDKLMSELNKENNRFLLPETSSFLSKMIQDSDASFVYEKIGTEIKHVMIDEFQDTSKLQWKNFKSLLSDIYANNAFSLIVGDVKQSIYRWRNGDWRILNSELKETFNISEKKLDTNYRSSKSVINFNNDFFKKAGNVIKINSLKLMDKNEDDLSKPENKHLLDFLSAYNEENVKQNIKNDKEGFVSIDIIDSKLDSDSNIDPYIKFMIYRLNDIQKAGIPPTDVCVLCRKNIQIKHIANTLSKIKLEDIDNLNENDFKTLKDEGYFNVISDEAFMLNSSSILNFIISALHFVDNWNDNVNIANVLSEWNQLKGEISNYHYLLNDIKNYDNKLPLGFKKSDLKKLQEMSLYELITYIYKVFDLDNLQKNLKQNQSAYIYTFFDYLLKYLQQNTNDLNEFLNYWDDDLSTKTIPVSSQTNGIQIMTIHKSKGLERPTIFVPYCFGDMSKSASGQFDKFVWCEKKQGIIDKQNNDLFPLEIYPITYNKKMENSIFSEEYKDETMMNWMDELNTLYVAFTRPKYNLFIFTELPLKSSSTFNIQDLITSTINDMGKINNSTNFCWGKLDYQERKSEKVKEENILKQNADQVFKDIFFGSNKNIEDACIFRQSNESKRFIKGEIDSENEYIKQGNVMHELFANIHTTNDIENAIKTMTLNGIFSDNETEHYKELLNNAINFLNINNKDWFSDKYKSINECSIIGHDNNGNIIILRPDRVMIKDKSVIVVDYKFGEFHKEHILQVKNYMLLINKMGYSDVKGFLWYVKNNNIITIND